MWNPLSAVRSEVGDCACSATFEGEELAVDAGDCPGSGRLADEPACRGTVVSALADREAERVVTRASGVERAYEGDAVALLVAAGRFVERAAFYDADLAARARRDPLGVGVEAAGRTGRGGRVDRTSQSGRTDRTGPISTVAAETGLAEGAHRFDSYRDVLRPFVGPTVARSRVAARPPANARLDDRRELSTGATVRVYSQPETEVRTYHLEPLEHAFDADACGTLARAHRLLADGGVGGGDRAPDRAVRRVVGEGAESDRETPLADLVAVLRKHTRDRGVLVDLFADPAVSDVFATAPVPETPLRATVDGERMRTNVRLTERGADALASRFRRTSGRAFSRASPTLDATAEVGDESIRVAGVTDPASDGTAFAFRARGTGDRETTAAVPTDAWRLPALVENDTLPADAAALLSVAVERAAAGLVAGTRGAGKTTLLGALLFELPPRTRTVVLEDTPELPIRALQSADRDVQALRTDPGDGPGLAPTDALRTALRLGEGALVVGEVRGEEASVLYEAMRVGASGSAVLGTIHGDGGAAVRERVVTDLGVPPSSFAATDFLVTLEPYETADGRARRVKSVEEVVGTDPRFESLYELGDGELVPTGRIERGNSALVANLARSTESYADVLDRLAACEDAVADRAELHADPAVTVRKMEEASDEPAGSGESANTEGDA